MKQQGRAGEALGISLYSGFVGGLFGLLMLVLLTEPLSRARAGVHADVLFRARHARPDVIASLSGGSLLKGLGRSARRLMIATVGTDPVSGVNRFTFDSADLLSGIQPILVMVGLFAVSELLRAVGEPVDAGRTGVQRAHPVAEARDDERLHASRRPSAAVIGTDRGRHARRRRHRRGVSCPTTRRSAGPRTGGIRQGLARRRRRAGDRQQYGREHGADPAAEPRHSRLEFGRRPAGWLPDPRPRPGADLFDAERRRGQRPLCRLFVATSASDRRLHDHAAVHVAGEPAAPVSYGFHLRARRVGRLLVEQFAVRSWHRRSASACSATRCGCFGFPVPAAGARRRPRPHGRIELPAVAGACRAAIT